MGFKHIPAKTWKLIHYLCMLSFSVFGTKKTFDTTRACGAVCNTKGGGMKEAKPAKLLDILS
jgi:hypothetical protein